MSHARQLDILDPIELIFPVTIIGAGGIGNPTALKLAKMGVQDITIYDFDSVEELNVSNSLFYKKSDIGTMKVEATFSNVKEFTGVGIKIKKEEFIDQLLNGIVVSAVDTLEARRNIWDSVKFNAEVFLFIDCRLGGEIMHIFTIRPCDIEDVEIYENNLVSTDRVAKLPCSAQTIIYTSSIVSDFAALKLKKWVKRQAYYRKVVFHLSNMVLLTQYKTTDLF